MRKGTLLSTTPEEVMARYEDSVAKYAISPAPVPLLRRILRAIERIFGR